MLAMLSKLEYVASVTDNVITLDSEKCVKYTFNTHINISNEYWHLTPEEKNVLSSNNIRNRFNQPMVWCIFNIYKFQQWNTMYEVIVECRMPRWNMHAHIVVLSACLIFKLRNVWVG